MAILAAIFRWADTLVPKPGNAATGTPVTPAVTVPHALYADRSSGDQGQDAQSRPARRDAMRQRVLPVLGGVVVVSHIALWATSALWRFATHGAHS